ncbi:MFS transporter [Alkalitalea saponilacus]|uniref:MFS transporter, OFA family, oxalate/formate antiporter n=1 Tax=Alkalitalea saponilacus TaxID=889453 RepID=A0A1T5HTP3_9BACT|nr:MFS transporter [Alkalitalea saponilacus]ASB49978.1 MFS transporter [Alkalitalea saponilacus]SKC24068.1 MFS transporter, OFA family, oxalate/formate antiporter [Alkalitalea saponilacus]
MQKFLTVLSAFFIMLCLGGVYAWSVFVPGLMAEYNFSSFQTQLIFGSIIAVFPTTMLLAGILEKKLKPVTMGMISAALFTMGYLLAGFSNGNFWMVLFGIGILSGVGTGFGYLVSLTTPVKWFPEKKGLITGIAAAGFGLAAVVLSFLAETLLDQGRDVLHIFTKVGLGYGLVIFLLSFFLKAPSSAVSGHRVDVRYFFKSKSFVKLLFGIFFGTFAGLLVIGSLSPIGEVYYIDGHVLVVGVSVFAVANFLGRLSWGMVSDYLNTEIVIFSALTLQAVSIFLLGFLHLTEFSYIVLSAMIGFGFGANFVLFAKETSHLYGIANLGIVYPYVLLGYAVAGIVGPVTGGVLYDITGSFNTAIYIAAFMSMMGAILFLIRVKTSSKSTKSL